MNLLQRIQFVLCGWLKTNKKFFVQDIFFFFLNFEHSPDFQQNKEKYMLLKNFFISI